MVKLKREENSNWNENTNENMEKSRLWNMARRVFFMYRTMSHPELNGESPAEVLHGRQPKNLLSLLKQSHTKRRKETELHSKPERKELFPVSSLVYTRNYRYGPKWLPGKVIRSEGVNVRLVECSRGIWKRHCNQLQVHLSDRADRTSVSRSTDPVRITDPIPNADQPSTRTKNRSSDQPGEVRRYPIRNRRRTSKYGFDPM